MITSANTSERTGLHAVIQDVPGTQERESALKESQLNLQAIFNHTSDGFVLADIHGIVKSFNNKAKERIRLNTGQEITVAKSIYDFLPESRKEIYRDTIAKVLSGETLQYDHPYTRQNGQTKWFSFTINPVYNAEEIEGIAITSADITERKRAEQQLKKSELFHNGILDSLSAHIAVIDHKGNIVAVNKAWDDFANANGVNNLTDVSVGSNYFEVCERSLASGDIKAGQTLQGIRSVFNKEIRNFELEYPCHSLTEHRWFNLSVTSFGEDDSKAVVSHQNITERKIAEQKSEKSESRLKEAQAVANIGSWETDLQTLNVTWSEQTHHIFATDPKKFQATHKAFLSFIHPDDRNKVNTAFENSINSQTVNSVEHRIISTNGTIKQVLENWKIFPDEKGHPVRAVGTCQDITERKAAEEKVIKLNEEVAKSEKFFKGVIENSDDMLTMLDHTGKTLYASPAVSRKFGYTPAECLSLNIADIVHPADAVIMQEFIGKIMRHPGVPMECPLIRDKKKDGTYIWVEGTLTNFLETEGINAIVANFRDVTERKKADEENRFKANLLNTIGQAAIATDLNGVVNYWNRAAEKMYGWTKEEALGRYVIDMTTSGDTHEQAIQIMEALKHGQSWSGEFKVRKKDGTNFSALVTNSPIYDENNMLSGIIGVSSDITEIKKLEKLLAKTSSLAAVGSWEIDVVKGTVFWSDTTKEIREVDKDYVPNIEIGISYFKDGIHKDIISQKVKECIEHGTPWDEELQITTFKGNDKWVRTIGEGEFLNGKCIKIHGTFQDINVRKKAQIELLKVYEEKNSILESIEDGFFAVDSNWIITYWNKQSEKMSQRSTYEMIGKNLWEVYSDIIDSPYYINFNKAITENAAQHFESYTETSETWYELSAYPSVNGLSVYFRDITARKLAQEQIKEDKVLLRTLIDHLPDTIYYKDKSAKKIISNKFDYTVLGAKSEEEVLGKTDLEISSHANAAMTYAQDMEILSTGNSLINFEEYFTTAHNKPLWLLTTKLALRNENNEITGLLGIGRDITQRKIAEDKLIELNAVLERNVKQLKISNADLEQFAYVASHDLQEPLRMVTSFLTLLEKKYGNSIDDKGKQYINFAVDGAKRMRQIILDLLEFSRIGRAEDKTEEIDLNALVNDIVRLHSKQINETKALLNIAKLPVLNVSREPMRQVFQNLISNSLKYHKDGIAPVISISVISHGKFWQFAISDNGIGIGEAYLEKIFIIFQRLHDKEKYTGTGIGLAITKKIIENTGGSIRVESEEGKGSTFYFTLPKQQLS